MGAQSIGDPGALLAPGFTVSVSFLSSIWWYSGMLPSMPSYERQSWLSCSLILPWCSCLSIYPSFPRYYVVHKFVAPRCNSHTRFALIQSIVLLVVSMWLRFGDSPMFALFSRTLLSKPAFELIYICRVHDWEIMTQHLFAIISLQ